MPEVTTDPFAELRQECGYDEHEECSVDSLIDYKNALEDRYGGLLARAEQAHAELVRACDLDDEYWTLLACGQDTEEAESSGYLVGYRDALAAVIEAPSSPGTITGYAESVKASSDAIAKEIEEMTKAMTDRARAIGEDFADTEAQTEATNHDNADVAIVIEAMNAEELQLGDLDGVRRTGGHVNGPTGGVMVELTGPRHVVRDYVAAHWGDEEPDAYPELAR